MFVDNIVIKLIAGKGGDGCTSFRREKFVPMGGPDGGSGGKGSDIVFIVDKGLKTLIDLRYMKKVTGVKGVNGKGSNKNGANAKDVIIKVPQGTTLIDEDTGLVIADLVHEDDKCIVCHGGRGGRGNVAFATLSDPAPKMSEYGEPGEERIVRCELKILADVGLVGMPSVGKSTLLSAVTASNPKIGAYHFTTLNPNLGVVKLNDGRSFILADLPGLIKGASKGAGLGRQFLRHAMRTKVIAHVIDMGAFEGRDPLEDYEIIKNEVNGYSDKLAKKPQIVIANKMDLEGSLDNLNRFKKKYKNLPVVEISASNNIGLDDAMKKICDIVYENNDVIVYDDSEYESHVLYKFQNEKPYTITKEDGCWVLHGAEIEKLFKMTKFAEEESVLRFARKLRGMGVEEELEKMGAKRGDDVVILDYMFQFKE